MKLFRALLFALSLHQALGAKVVSHSLRAQAGGRKEKQDPAPADSVCPDGLENRYPASLPKSFSFLKDKALSQNASVWDTALLREALGADEDWDSHAGVTWILQAKFTSASEIPREFGFVGGEAGHFMAISVPPAARNKTIQVTAVPSAWGNRTEFQYMSNANWTRHVVTMTDICLAPKSCKNFDESLCPLHTKKVTGKKTGDTPARCCEKIFCKDTPDICAPSTQWEKKATFDEAVGSSLQSCCVPKVCNTTELCEPAEEWSPGAGTDESVLLGSTKSECCVHKVCQDHDCGDPTKWKKKKATLEDGSPRWGSAQEACCEPIHCSVFDCGQDGEWTLKANAAELDGNSKLECCDAKLCESFDCGPESMYFKNTSAHQGNTSEQCCIKRTCADYFVANGGQCKDSKAMEPRYEMIKGSRLGSSDADCCDMRPCKEFFDFTRQKARQDGLEIGDTELVCEHPLLWSPLALQYSGNETDRLGHTDKDCCEPKMCNANICEPSTAWAPKEGIDAIQGSTHPQCCEPIHCGNFTCDSDYDGDGIGTQWIKKIDTNHYKWQGSTTPECCIPRYCNQLEPPDESTKWKRKEHLVNGIPQEIKDLKGSTIAECYDKNMCSDYCCRDDKHERKLNADQLQGSTDAECCVLKEEYQTA